jgi:1-acyl-sn-glycerol-3-phosphate acyltransferase
MFYWFTRILVKIYLRAFLRLHVSGLHNVPAKGAAILAGNHPSALDSLLVMACLKRRYYCMQRADNFRNPVMGWYLRRLGALPAERGLDNSASLRQIEEWISKGYLFLTAPEGDVSVNGTVGPFRGKFLSLSLKLGAPVIPLSIFGSDKALVEPRRPNRLRHFIPRRVDVHIDFLKPRTFVNQNNDRELFDSHVRQVRQAIVDQIELMKQTREISV